MALNGLMCADVPLSSYSYSETPAIGTERCRTAVNRCITARPHHSDTATAPLATSTTCRLQDRRPGFPVPDRSGTGLPGGGLSAHRRRQRSSTSICRYSDLCHAPHVEHLRRPMLHSCGATDMELAANKSKTVSKSGTIQAFIKDIFV